MRGLLQMRLEGLANLTRVLKRPARGGDGDEAEAGSGPLHSVGLLFNCLARWWDFKLQPAQID